MKFDQLKIDPRLLRGIAERGYTEMTAVQEKTLARSLEGTDVAVQSQTGTGKTAAFLITLFNRMISAGARGAKKALIIVPTRELAVQIEKEARLLNRHLRFSIGSFYGGVGYEAQMASLRKGLDIAVGTPGRLIDLSERGALKLGEIGLLVIDEADRLLDMGFLPDIKKLVQKMAPRTERQTLMFSATMNRVSRDIAASNMNRPVFIETTPERLTVGATVQGLYHVKNQAKISLMLGILKAEAPQNALIFTNKKHHASRLKIPVSCRDGRRRPGNPHRQPGNGHQLRSAPGSRELRSSDRPDRPGGKHRQGDLPGRGRHGRQPRGHRILHRHEDPRPDGGSGPLRRGYESRPGSWSEECAPKGPLSETGTSHRGRQKALGKGIRGEKILFAL